MLKQEKEKNPESYVKYWTYLQQEDNKQINIWISLFNKSVAIRLRK